MRRVVLLLSQSGMVARLLPVFREAGFETLALGPPGDPVRRSRHLGTFVPVSTDPNERVSDWGRWASAHLSDEDWVVPGSDDAIWAVLDSGLSPDRQARLLPVDRPEALYALDSKQGMAAALARAGVRQPAWRWAEKREEVAALAGELGFPVMVKQGRSRAGGGVQVLRRSDEPLRLTAASRTRGLLVERWVPGELVSMEAVYRRGTLTLLASSQVLCWLGEAGVSVARRYEDVVGQELLEGLSSLGRDLGLDGVGNISAIRDADGRLWVFEVDMRPNSWHAYLPGIGVDLAAALTTPAADGLSAVRRSPASPAVVRNLSRSMIHICSPRGLSTLPGLLSRSETWDHVMWGDIGLLPGESARWLKRWARHLRQGATTRLRPRRRC